jgi:hypothetical protein
MKEFAERFAGPRHANLAMNAKTVGLDADIAKSPLRQQITARDRLAAIAAQENATRIAPIEAANLSSCLMHFPL